MNKFERKLPDDRRRILIAATLKCLSQDGQEGMSVRRISTEAGISVGLINHHYNSKDDLIAQAYETLTMSLLDFSRNAVDREDGGARERLAALVRSMFEGPVLDPGVLRCWLVFWGMIQKGSVLKDVHDRTYRDYRVYVEGLLRQLATEYKVPLLDIRLAAIGLLALVDGLWIEWCLNQTTFTPEEAIRLCDGWIDAMLLRKAA